MTLAAFTLPTAQQIVDEVGQFDTINVVTNRVPTRPRSSGPSPGSCRPEWRWSRVRRCTNEQTSSIDQGAVVLLDRAADIRLDRPLRRRVHHLQHLLDHRRPADPRAGPPARRRRQPPPGVPLRAGRGGHGGAGLVADRRRARRAAPPSASRPFCRGFGITLPSGTLVFEARTVVVSLVVGIGVTVVAAVGPARRAVRIPPVAALRDGQPESDVSSRRRFGWGGALALVGALLIGVGLARPAIQLVGLGAVGPLRRRGHARPCLRPPVLERHRASPGPAFSGWPASWAGRTPCAAPAAPLRPHRR